MAEKKSNPRVAAFVAQYDELAGKVASELNVPRDAVLGQWGLETGWGKSVIPGTNNLGNIKDFSGKGPKAKDNMNGSVDSYRQYEDAQAFGEDFKRLLGKKRYANALNTKDAASYFTGLKTGGYAEDPNYISSGTKAAAMVAAARGTPADPVVQATAAKADQVTKAAPLVDTAKADLFTMQATGGAKRDSAKDAVRYGDPASTGWQSLDLRMEGLRRTPVANAATEAMSSGFMDESASLQADNTRGRMERAAFEADVTKAQYDKDNTGYTDAAWAAITRDKSIQSIIPIYEAMTRDREAVPKGWRYSDYRDEMEAGLAEHERLYMRENVRGPESLARVKKELGERRELQKLYGDAGALASFFGQMTGGLVDPVGLAAGFGVGKAFQVAGIGSRALMAANKINKARGSLAVEAAIGNMLVEGVADASGEVKGLADYALAGALGVGMVAPFMPFMRGQPNAAVVGEADDAVAAAQAAAVRANADGRAEAADIDSAADEAAGLEELNTGGRRMNQLLPEDVQQTIREEAEGTVHTVMEEPTPVTPEQTTTPTAESPDVEAPEPPPVIENPAPRMEPTEREAYVQAAAEGEVERVIGTTADGEEVRVNWIRKERTPKEGDMKITEVLDRVLSRKDVPESLRAIYSYLRKSRKDGDIDAAVFRFETRPSNSRTAGMYRTGEGTVSSYIYTPAPARRKVGSQAILDSVPVDTLRTIAHELTHAATATKVEAFLRGRAIGQVAEAAKELQEVFEAFKLQQSDNFEVKYAKGNLHEFVAQLMTEPDVQAVLAGMPATTKQSALPRSLWTKALSAIAKMLGVKAKSNTALAQAMRKIDQIITASDARYVDAEGSPILYAEAPPAALALSERKKAEKIIRHATRLVDDNPIRLERLKTLLGKLKKFGGLSDGLVLAGSGNKVLNAVSIVLTETTTGAAGRGATVAVRSEVLRTALVGRGLSVLQSSRDNWAKSKGYGLVSSHLTGKANREFDLLVVTEIHKRRHGGTDYRSEGVDPHVLAAVEELEAGFERALKAEIEAGVLGADRLPENSRGYMPQVLDGAKLQELAQNPARYVEAAKMLADQLRTRMGWTDEFASLFSRMYLDRARERAMDDSRLDGISMGGSQGSQEIVRETLQMMGENPDMRDAAAMAASELGVGHTKKRLNFDLTERMSDGTTLMENMYSTDIAAIYRRYQHGAAANVALTEAGIPGVHGVRNLRTAALQVYEGQTPATLQEIEAFDRVFAEVLGTRIAGEVRSTGASNLGMLVGLQRLGGLVWTQFQETWNMLHHVGLRSTLAGIPTLRQHMSEIKEYVKTGKMPENTALRSMEVYGSVFGSEGYTMVMPLDVPATLGDKYMEQPGIVARLLRGGAHAQTVITGFRALIASQHRMVAEQITLKALRYIRDGKSDVALREMGFTDEVVSGMRYAIEEGHAKWDQQGNLIHFDITKVEDPLVREAFVQGVHRGTGQIIQRTYVGERSKWLHNDYIKLTAQLRTFGLTAMEKQWSRTRMDHGTAQAVGLLLGQMALALPMHTMRAHFASIGREDREQYLKDNTSFAGLVRASMNYTSLSGLGGDMLEIAQGFSSWASNDTREMLGGRNGGGTSIGRVIPIAGSFDAAARVLQGRGDVYTGIKQLPFNSVWWLAPAINLSK